MAGVGEDRLPGEAAVRTALRALERPRVAGVTAPGTAEAPVGASGLLPPGAVELQRDLLLAMWERDGGARAPALPLEGWDAAAEGEPLLRRFPPRLERGPLTQRARRVARVLSARGSAAGGEALVWAFGRSLDPAALGGEVLAGRAEAVNVRARQLGLDPQAVAGVLRLALYPALTRVATALSAALGSRSWEHGYCPCCGSWPLLAEERGLESRRVLRCALCAAGWGVARLRCPTCGERDHASLGSLAPEGDETRWRVLTCSACGCYVKLVSTLQPPDAAELLVLDLFTLPLDVVALDRGLERPA